VETERATAEPPKDARSTMEPCAITMAMHALVSCARLSYLFFGGYFGIKIFATAF